MGKYSIGIDLGGTKILTAIVDRTNGEIISSVKKKTKKDKGIEKIIKKIINSINEVLEASDKQIEEIDTIGIGAAGQVNREDGIIINAPNIDCRELNIKELLEKEFNKPVLLGNDVEIATIGEMYFGAGKNEKDFVCIFVGTGIGSGIVQDGKIRYGTTVSVLTIKKPLDFKYDKIGFKWFALKIFSLSPLKHNNTLFPRTILDVWFIYVTISGTNKSFAFVLNSFIFSKEVLSLSIIVILEQL